MANTDVLTRLADAWATTNLVDSGTAYAPNPYDMLGGASASTLPVTPAGYSAGDLQLYLRILIPTTIAFSGAATSVTIGVAYADALNGSNLMVTGTGNVFTSVKMDVAEAALLAGTQFFIPVPPLVNSATDGAWVLGKRYLGCSVALAAAKGTATGSFTIDLVRGLGDMRRYYPAVQ